MRRNIREICLIILVCYVLCFSRLSYSLSISELYNKLHDNVLRQMVFFVSDFGVVCGAVLVVMGVVTLYNSHVKQASGGKPLYVGVVALFAGSLLMGLPLVYRMMSGSLIGYHTIGDNQNITGDQAMIIPGAK